MLTRLRGRALGSRACDDRGAVTVIVVLFLLVFMALLAFVVDFGRVYATQAKLQNAADAGSLAGGQLLTCGDNTGNAAIKTEAELYAIQRNEAPVALATVGAKSVTTQTSETVDMFFGSFVGRPTIPVSKRATASIVCQVEYVMFGEEIVDFNSNNQTVGPIYAGASFKLASVVGVYIESVSVYVNGPTPACKSTGTPKDPIDPAANSPSCPPVNTPPYQIGQRIYNENGGVKWGAAAYAFAKTDIPQRITDAESRVDGFKGPGSTNPDVTVGVYTGPCSQADEWIAANPTKAANPLSVIRCPSGALDIKDNFAGAIIDYNGKITTTARITGPLLYSAAGDIELKSGVGEIFGSFYAPVGEVQITGTGSPKADVNCEARLVGKTLDVNGASVSTGCNPGTNASGGIVSLTE